MQILIHNIYICMYNIRISSSRKHIPMTAGFTSPFSDRCQDGLLRNLWQFHTLSATHLTGRPVPRHVDRHELLFLLLAILRKSPGGTKVGQIESNQFVSLSSY